MFNTPVLLCVFNRPHLTARVFEAIRQQAPTRLLIIADGPRDHRAEDAELVRRTREIVGQVDWDCDVLTQFSETNLGCRQRMATGLNWAFEQESQLIVLEDDCLPSPTFFTFCQSMLERFQDDDRIGSICGDQFLKDFHCETDAYYSKYPFVWGWASWRRAWQHYDLAMKRWPQRHPSPWLDQICVDPQEAIYWRNLFQQQFQEDIDTWDYSWIFNSWDQQLLSIHPAQNLVSNIGFGADATHTTDADSELAELPFQHGQPHSTYFSLPKTVAADPAIESRIFHEVYCPPSRPAVINNNWLQRKWNRLKRLWREAS